MNVSSLVLTQFDKAQVSLMDEAFKKRDEILVESANVAIIFNGEDQKVAVEVLRKIKSLTAEIEKDRKDIKAPILELGKKIDSVAKEFLVKISEESNRIGGLISQFQQEEQERQRKEIEKTGSSEPVAEADGMYTKKEPKIEIVDIDLLYKSCPHMVELSPKLNVIKEAVKKGIYPSGVKVEWETKTVVMK